MSIKLRPLSYFLIICFILLVTSCSQESIIARTNETLFKIGDQQEWATNDFNDQNWQRWLWLVPDGQVFWSRTKIDILEEPEALKPYGVYLHTYGEYEVFWDGVLIGKNGNPGQEEALGQVGKMWTTHRIPTHLTKKGTHVLALRSSLYYFPDHARIAELEIDYYDDLLTNQVIESSYMHLFAGSFLIASFYFLFLFLTNKKEPATLVFSISCCLLYTSPSPRDS